MINCSGRDRVEPSGSAFFLFGVRGRGRASRCNPNNCSCFFPVRARTRSRSIIKKMRTIVLFCLIVAKIACYILDIAKSYA